MKNLRQTAKNYTIIRFSDVLLMAAEAEIEVGSMEKAREYINRVRVRTANPGSMISGAPANYQTKEYTQAFADQPTARNAVRFERRPELAMEGHRFFDLVGWGIAAETLNAYLQQEKERRGYLKASGGFTKGKDEYYPISNPVIEIAKKMGNNMDQNPGY